MKLVNEKLVNNKLAFKIPNARWASAVLPVKKPVDKKANNIAAANGKEIEIQRRHTVDFRRVNNRTQPKKSRT
jgi:hypothetical protein